MALDSSLNGIRNRFITQLHGRRLFLTFGNSSDNSPHYLGGPVAHIAPVDGWSAGGSTVTSTSVANLIPPYGVTVVGATGASATTAYLLAAPVPGVSKTIFNPTTGGATILTTGSGAFICSTGSAASTQGSITFLGKGSYVDLIGLTTALWGLRTFIGTATTAANVTIA